MAIKFGFFNSVGGDRKYTAADIGNYLMGIVSSGVYADDSTSLQVLADNGLNVQVQVGRAMLHYHYMENDSPLALTLDAGGSQDRIDAIVARCDMINRLCEITVKKGTEAAIPAAPAMTRTETVKEYMLASVHVKRLSTAITQANITDTRANNAVCGWVTGIINQVDTTTLFNQWKAAYDEAMAEMAATLATQQQTFEEWYAGLTENYADSTGLPIPGAEDAGKVPVVNESGNGYTLRNPTVVFYATLATDAWEELDGRYVQTVAVDGIKETDAPSVDIYLDGLTADQEDAVAEAWGDVVKITTENGSITAYFAEPPAVDIPLMIERTATTTGSTGQALTAIDFTNLANGSFTETVSGEEILHSVTYDDNGYPIAIDGVTITWPTAEVTA